MCSKRESRKNKDKNGQEARMGRGRGDKGKERGGEVKMNKK